VTDIQTRDDSEDRACIASRGKKVIVLVQLQKNCWALAIFIHVFVQYNVLLSSDGGLRANYWYVLEEVAVLTACALPTLW